MSPALGYSAIPNFANQQGYVMVKPVKVYLIWYGTWNSSSQAIIRNFVKSVGAKGPVAGPAALYNFVPSVAGWWSSLTSYENSNGKAISAKVSLAGEVFDTAYSQGKALKDAEGDSILKKWIGKTTTQVPTNRNAVYVILTAADVTVRLGNNVGDFCRDWCAVHSDKGKIKYSFVGNPAANAIDPNTGNGCMTFCSRVPVTDPPTPNWGSPNWDAPTDGIVSSLAHELAEMVSDPDGLNGWNNAKLETTTGAGEIGDICLGMFGDTVNSVPTTFDETKYAWTSGPQYNVFGLNGMKFVVQQLINVAAGTCATAGPASPAVQPAPFVGNVACPSGTCMFLYPHADFRGTPLTVTGVGSGVNMCTNLKQPIGSWTILWNNPSKEVPQPTGCNCIYLWQAANCGASSGTSAIIDIRSYVSMAYDTTAEYNVALDLGDWVRSNTLSVQCTTAVCPA